MKRVYQVGYLHILEDCTMQRSYECAAWYTEVRIKAGRYPLNTDGYWLLASLPGVIESDNFQSLYGGCAIGQSYDTAQNAGKPSAIGFQSYAYALRDMIAAGTASLLPGITLHRSSMMFNDFGMQYAEDYSHKWLGPRQRWYHSFKPVPQRRLTHVNQL